MTEQLIDLDARHSPPSIDLNFLFQPQQLKNKDNSNLLINLTFTNSSLDSNNYKQSQHKHKKTIQNKSHSLKHFEQNRNYLNLLETDVDLYKTNNSSIPTEDNYVFDTIFNKYKNFNEENDYENQNNTNNSLLNETLFEQKELTIDISNDIPNDTKDQQILQTTITKQIEKKRAKKKSKMAHEKKRLKEKSNQHLDAQKTTKDSRPHFFKKFKRKSTPQNQNQIFNSSLQKNQIVSAQDTKQINPSLPNIHKNINTSLPKDKENHLHQNHIIKNLKITNEPSNKTSSNKYHNSSHSNNQEKGNKEYFSQEKNEKKCSEKKLFEGEKNQKENEKRKEIEMKKYYSKLFDDLTKTEIKIKSINSEIVNQLHHCIHHRLLAIHSLLKNISTPISTKILKESVIEVENGIQNYCIATQESTNFISRALLAIYDSLNENERNIVEIYLKGDPIKGDIVDLLILIQKVLITTQEIEIVKNLEGWEMLENVKKMGEKEWKSIIQNWININSLHQTFINVDIERYPVFAWGRSILLKKPIECWVGYWKEMELIIMEDTIVIKTNKIKYFSEMEWTEITTTDDYNIISNTYRGNYYIKTTSNIVQLLKNTINNYLQNKSYDIYVFPLQNSI
ncbi:hypothetical protein QTN25_008793 [Entamoeba marina]